MQVACSQTHPCKVLDIINGAEPRTSALWALTCYNLSSPFTWLSRTSHLSCTTSSMLHGWQPPLLWVWPVSVCAAAWSSHFHSQFLFILLFLFLQLKPDWWVYGLEFIFEPCNYWGLTKNPPKKPNYAFTCEFTYLNFIFLRKQLYLLVVHISFW